MTKKELIEKLETEGIILGGNPERMIAKLVSLGFIAKPIRYGLGKGKGFRIEFEDRVFDEIKEVVKLRTQGLTYEQIKYKKMEEEDWVSFFSQLKRSSKTEDDFLKSIKKIPFLSDSEKGQLKLGLDLADHLSRLVTEEISDFLALGFDNSRYGHITDVARTVLEWFVFDVLSGSITLSDEDYQAYLEGRKPEWRPLTSNERIISEMVDGGLKEDKKNKEGGT